MLAPFLRRTLAHGSMNVPDSIKGSPVCVTAARCGAGHEPEEEEKRKGIEECFGWLKTIALMRKVRHRGVSKVHWLFTFACAAYNLVRTRNLAAAVGIA